MPIYSPGNEPDRIKDRIKTLFERIDSAYPDKIIVGLHSNHKKMGETVSEIYKALGYESGKDFLEAYGYKCEKKASGRPKSVDPHAIIKALQGKYPNGSPFDTVDDLFSDNPEYLPKLKSLKNASSEVFGMPLKRYLLTLGLIQQRNQSDLRTRHEPAMPKSEQFIICTVKLPTVAAPHFYQSKLDKLRIRDYVEVPVGANCNLVFGQIESIKNYTEEDAPCQISEIKSIRRVVGKKEYERGFFRSALIARTIPGDNKDAQKCISKSLAFCAYMPLPVNGEILWACCRGNTEDIVDVLDYLAEKDPDVYDLEDIILITNQIAELFVYTEDVDVVVAHYPKIKVAAFSKNRSEKQIELLYSRSGCAFFSDRYLVGAYSTDWRENWTLRHIVDGILAAYQQESIDGLEMLAERIQQARSTEKSVGDRLKMHLAGESLQELEARASAIITPVRDEETIAADIHAMCGKESIAAFIGGKNAMVEGYAKEYSSTETLAAAVDSKAKERREAETRMAEMPEIPEEYLHVTEPKAYLEKLKRSEEIADAECKDALKEKTAAERDLDSYQNEMDGEDLLENCERAQRELEEQKALLKHWFHIRDVFEEQKAQLRGNPMEDITKHFACYLGLISGGKVFPEFPQTDKLDMNIYSGDRLVNYRRLSEGTKETVYLAFRLAVLDHLFPNGGGVIVLDDPLTDMDEERVEQSCALIRDCAERHQVIFLTCREAYLPQLQGNVIRI